MSILDYSLSEDFSGNIKIDQFHKEIVSNASITTSLNGIVYSENDVQVIFNDTITSNEGNVLSLLISSHTPDFSPDRIRHYKIYPEIRRKKGTNYEIIATFHYTGSDSIGKINYVDLISSMHTQLTSYDVQLINRENNNILAYTNLTNTKLGCVTLGIISNTPTSPSTLDLSIRCNGKKNKHVIVQEIQVWYGE